MSEKRQISGLMLAAKFKDNKNVPVQSTNQTKLKKKNKKKLKLKEGGSLLRQTTNGGVTKVDKAKVAAAVKDSNNSVVTNSNKNESILKLDDFGNMPNGSINEAKNLLVKLLSPITTEQFFKKYWEKEPLLIKRDAPKFFSEVMSIKTVDQILRNNNMEFTKNIDITEYVDGVRKTLNPDGRALPPAVWDFYESGCSIRLLDPHTYIPSVYKMCSILQELFHSRAGANVYLTPKGSQGFAPHYDDIEAFVLQVEGKKRWRVYAPRSEEETLPRVSSKNFEETEIGSPILETTLEPGDLLYFPRGFIHQANTVDGYHSLHITLSVYQQHSIGDYLKLAVNTAIDRAIAENVHFRAGLPLTFFNEMGLVYSDRKSDERVKIMNRMNELFTSIKNYADLDMAADEMAKKYQHEAMPPFISDNNKDKTIYGDERDDKQITDKSKVRLVKAHIFRLVHEEDVYRLYFHNDNTMTFQEKELNFIEILDEDCSIVDCLIKTYPKYATIEDLPHDEDSRKVEVVKDLFNLGFIMVQ